MRTFEEDAALILELMERYDGFAVFTNGSPEHGKKFMVIASHITTTAYAEIIAREQVRRQAAAMLDACVVVPADQRVATGSFPHIDTKEEVTSETSEVKPKYSE